MVAFRDGFVDPTSVRGMTDIAGTEVAKESADVIILDDNFSTIATVAKWGRSVYIKIQKFVQFQLTVNVVALVVNFTSACVTGTAPLTAVQFLWVNMIMDTLGALALSTEPPTDELMKRAPVGRKGNFITNVMWRNILGKSLYQFIIIRILQAKGKSVFRLDEGIDSNLTLNTLLLQLIRLFSGFQRDKLPRNGGNRCFQRHTGYLCFRGGAQQHCLVPNIIVEFLGTFESTTPLTFTQWFFSIFVGFLGMPVAAGLKMIPV